MDKQTIRFVSQNSHKLDEARRILASCNVDIERVSARISEIQSEDMRLIVEDKVVKAFEQIGRPLFVEQTGLYLAKLNGFPGGLTQVFWDSLQADRFSELFGNCEPRELQAKTMIGFTDGRRIHLFEGEISGKVASAPRGPRDFQWDCVFIPDGYDVTFAELGEKKDGISMRRRALDKLADYLNRRESKHE